MWWQTGLMVGTLLFLILAGYAIRLLRTANAALRRADAALETMQVQVQNTATESEQLIRLSIELVQDLQAKLRVLDTWFDAAKEAGEAVHLVSRSVTSVSQTLEKTVLEAHKALHSSQETVNDVKRLTTAGLHLWQRWIAFRQSKKEE